MAHKHLQTETQDHRSLTPKTYRSERRWGLGDAQAKKLAAQELVNEWVYKKVLNSLLRSGLTENGET